MLPLEKDLNSKCKDLELPEKIIFYKKSNYKLTQMFVDLYEKSLTGAGNAFTDLWEKEIITILRTILEIVD